MRSTLASAIAACLLLAGCSAGTVEPTPTPTPEPTSSSPSPSPTPTAEPLVSPLWTSEGVSQVGYLVAMDDLVVSHFVRDQAFFIGVWQAADGTKLWEAPARTSYTPDGVWITPARHSPSTVAYLSGAASDEWSVVTVADVRTGQVIGTSQPIWAQSRPSTCAEGACVSGQLADGQVGNWAIGPDAQLSPATSEYLPPNSRLIGDGIYSTNARPGEVLGHGSGGAAAWERSYEEVFGAGYSSDGGWEWRIEEGWPFIGAGYFFDENPDGRAMTGSMIVGLDPATGATLWQVPGGDFCGEADEAGVVPVCVFTSGTITYSTDTTPAVYTDLVVELQGIDPATGQPRWRVPLDAANWGPTYGSPFINRADAAIRYVDGAASVIDFATGEVTALADDAVLACLADRAGVDVLNDPGYELRGLNTGPATTPCDLQRNPVPSFSASAIEAAGTVAGDYLVVVTPTGLQGYAR